MDTTLPLDEVSRVFSFLPDMTLAAAVAAGNVDLVKLLVAVDKSQCTAQHMDDAAWRGHFEIIQFLHDASPAGCTKTAMNGAARCGHLEIVQFLHVHYPEVETTHAASQAVCYGHPAVARFLIQHRFLEIEPCVLRFAAYYNQLEVIADYLDLNPSASTTEAKYTAVVGDKPARDTIQILKLLYEKGEDKTPSQALRYAAEMGRVDLVQYLVTQGEGFVRDAMAAAVANRHLAVLQHLLQFATAELDDSIAATWVDTAATNGDLAMVSYLRDKFPEAVCSAAVFVSAAERGQLAMAKILHRAGRTDTCGVAIRRAASHHHFEVVKFLAPDCEDAQLQEAAVAALENGHFEITKYLVVFRMGRDKGTERGYSDRPSCYLCEMYVILNRVYRHGANERSAKALAAAAGVGDLDVVTYLAERNIGDLQHAVMRAIGSHHLHVVKYLLESTSVVRNQRISQLNWLGEAARTGHLEILVYLQENVPGLVCQPSAMDHAAAMGYLDVVQFLHMHRSEGCTTKAMDGAAMGNHFEMVRFLRAHRTEGCSKRAFEKSAERGLTDMVKVLLEIAPSKCNVDKCISLAGRNGFAKTIAVLEEFVRACV